MLRSILNSVLTLLLVGVILAACDSNPPTSSEQLKPFFPLTSYSGQLGLQSSINFELVTKATVKNSSDGNELIELNETYIEYVKQSLYWLDFEAAKVDLSSSSLSAQNQNPIVVTLYVNDEAYEVIYDLELNAYLLGKHYYYADHQIAQMMQLLFNPSSKLAVLESLLYEDYLVIHENESNREHSYEPSYEPNQFKLNQLDYHGWENYLKEHQATKVIYKEYNIVLDQIAPIIYNEEMDVLFSEQLYFFSDKVETVGGIKVGLTKDEIVEKLGEPNYKSSTKWSYYIGDSDYLKFHLYLEEEKIVMIALTMPI